MAEKSESSLYEMISRVCYIFNSFYALSYLS